MLGGGAAGATPPEPSAFEAATSFVDPAATSFVDPAASSNVASNAALIDAFDVASILLHVAKVHTSSDVASNHP